jgi:hypothetical protein
MWIDKAMRDVAVDSKTRMSWIDSCSWKVMGRGRSKEMGEVRMNCQMVYEVEALMIVEQTSNPWVGNRPLAIRTSARSILEREEHNLVE